MYTMKGNGGKRSSLWTGNLLTIWLALTGIPAMIAPATAQTAHTPKPGSAERKSIFNALRISVEKDIGMPVVFVSHQPEATFRVVKDWAFVESTFQNPDGTPMGKAYYAKMGDVSADVQALLHRVKGKWKVVTHVTAPTDVEWEDWPAKYHAPANVVPHEDKEG